MEYTNRKGKTYYLYAGTTKTGKPRYYSSSKDSSSAGALLEQLPEGYEIYERPGNAQVFIRKQRPRLITELEEQLIKKELRKLHQPDAYLFDCKDDYLTIYEAARVSYMEDNRAGIGHVEDKIRDILGIPAMNQSSGMSFGNNILRTAMSQGDYTAVLRFYLSDRETRTFTAERFCFRGSIDDWIHLGGPDRFRNIVTQYIKYLGTDQFYELPHL